MCVFVFVCVYFFFVVLFVGGDVVIVLGFVVWFCFFFGIVGVGVVGCGCGGVWCVVWFCD